MPLDSLLDRGRAQGHLSLSEVRAAFDAAGISAAQGRSILRELTDAGISLASGDDDGPAERTAATSTKATTKAGGRKAAEKLAEEPEPDDEAFDVTAVEVAEQADLDDTSSVM